MPMKDTMRYAGHWVKPHYVASKHALFECVDRYIGRPVSRILDIGCGFALTSKLFQDKYGTELYLLEGEKEGGTGERTGKWGKVDDFRYYLPVSLLQETWQSQGMDFTFVNGDTPCIDQDIKFDLVYSWLSCGFHYPVSTYRNLIKQHTTADSVIIMDFRCFRGRFFTNFAEEGIEVIKEIDSDDKKRTLHIRFL